MTPAAVSEIWIYPVKGARGVAVSTVDLDRWGLVGDRRALVITPDGRMVTQRTHPRLAQVEARWVGGDLHLHHPQVGAVVVRPPAATADRPTFTIWKHSGLRAPTAGPDAAAWWTELLGEPALLVLADERFERPLAPRRGRGGDQVGFADGAPLLSVLRSSWQRLNDWIQEGGEEPVPLDRFRANVVIDGFPPFADDGWHRLRLGVTSWRDPWPCARCVVTTTDQRTGERGREPLRTLARYRRDPRQPTDVNFGVNWIPENPTGTLRIGDGVSVDLST